MGICSPTKPSSLFGFNFCFAAAIWCCVDVVSIQLNFKQNDSFISRRNETEAVAFETLVTWMDGIHQKKLKTSDEQKLCKSPHYSWHHIKRKPRESTVWGPLMNKRKRANF